MKIADVASDIDHELLSHDAIEARIREVAAQVSADYAEYARSSAQPLLLIAVLKGAVNTLTAFSQALSIPVEIDFMSLSSYGHGTVSSGDIVIRQDLSVNVAGRRVLIVEDIIDSGRTLDWLAKLLKERGAQSVDIFALLRKPARLEVPVSVTYSGFDIPDEFVVGFGLDFDERYRNLDSLAVLKSRIYEGEHA